MKTPGPPTSAQTAPSRWLGAVFIEQEEPMENIAQMTPEDAVRATLHGYEFHYELPPEISDAIREGIVAIGDYRWTRSDDPHRANFLALTPAGWNIARQLRIVPPQDEILATTHPTPLKAECSSAVN